MLRVAVVFAATFHILCGATNAIVHRIDVVHQHISPNEYYRLHGSSHSNDQLYHAKNTAGPEMSRQDRLQIARMCQMERELKGESVQQPHIDAAAGIPLTTWNVDGSILAGNILLGTPPQTFFVDFELTSSNLYVIGKGATYDFRPSSSESNVVDDKQTYDSSASTSYTATNANFSHNYNYINGKVVRDTFTLGNLTADINVEVASKVASRLQYYNYDGVFGLSSTIATNTTETLLGQLSSSLDSPVFTIQLNRTYYGRRGAGQITLGGLAPDTCKSSWTELGTSTNFGPFTDNLGLPFFNISGASTTPYGGGCELRLDYPVPVSFSLYRSKIYASIQVRDLFVQASNATFNRSSWEFEVTAEEKANAKPVFLNLPNGNTLRIDPDDYIYDYDSHESNPQGYHHAGGHYLGVFGDYDELRRNIGYYDDYLVLGMNFVNNHCLSKNFQTGVWSVAETLKEFETADAVSDDSDQYIYS